MGVRGHYTFSLTLDKGHFITEFRQVPRLLYVLRKKAPYTADSVYVSLKITAGSRKKKSGNSRI